MLIKLSILLIASQFLLIPTQCWFFESNQVRGPGVIDDENHELFANIEPFNDKLLPKSQLAGVKVPGLGTLMRLDTFMKPKPVQSMGTSFSLLAKNTKIREIKFKPVSERATPIFDTGAFDSDMGSFNDEDNDDGQSIDSHYQYDLVQMSKFAFNATKKTVIIIPGYRTREDDIWVREASDGWLSLYGDEVQVITVSWTDSNHGIYSQAVANTILVARQLTIFLYYLLKLSSGPQTDNWNDQRALDNIHLVGHSCGAHIAGFVGQDFGGRLGRITGLDPAGPSFDQFPPDQRLERNDAKLVEVLHTNSGKLHYVRALASTPMLAFNSLWSSDVDERGLVRSGSATDLPKQTSNFKFWFGIDEQCGHIDYYANDGSEQPGCQNNLNFCNHGRAVKIYVDLLRYEISLQHQHYSNPLISERNNNLMAYKASSYETFATGQSFAKECTDLLSIGSDHLNSMCQEDRRSECAVPLLDFMQPLDELIRDLTEKYHVDFSVQANNNYRPRYYFKTSAGELSTLSKNNLVGDHHLLRIYLADDDDDEFRWRQPIDGADHWCSLRVELLMDNGETVKMDLSHLEVSKVAINGHHSNGGQKQSMLAIPFVHPAGSEARRRLEHLLSVPIDEREQVDGLLEDGNSRGQLASAEFSSLFRHLMPKTIVLAVNENKPAEETSRPTCQLNVIALEVGPLDVRAQSVGALYGNNLALDERLPVLTGDQLLNQLQKLQENKFATQLAAGGVKSGGRVDSVGVSLEAVLIEQ